MGARPFRILMVLDKPFPPDTRVLNEALSLIADGFEVTVLSVGPDDRPRRDAFRGIQIIRHKISNKLRNRMRGLAGSVPLLTAYLDRLIPQVFAEGLFDALHMHDLYLVGGGLRAGRRLHVPVVADLHENWVQALSGYAWSTRLPGKLFVNLARWQRLERRWLHAADRVIVVVEEARTRVMQLGIPHSKITAVPNTIYIDDFEQFAIEESVVAATRAPFSIVYTGGLDTHRGLDTLIAALPHVIAAGPAHLTIVGEGRIRPELEALALALGVADHITFTGWQLQPRIKSYIQGSDVCVVPHIRTGHTDATLPHKLFHFMYMTRPVVVTDCKPIARIVRETSCGLVCRAGDAISMSEALVRLSRSPEERRQMGENGHRAVVEKYNWAHTVQPMLTMYRALAATR